MTMSIGFDGFCYSGYYMMPIETSPAHSGLFFGYANTIGTVAGALSPVYVGAVINGKGTFDEWKAVFFVSVAAYLVMCLLYILMGTVEE